MWGSWWWVLVVIFFLLKCFRHDGPGCGGL